MNNTNNTQDISNKQIVLAVLIALIVGLAVYFLASTYLVGMNNSPTPTSQSSSGTSENNTSSDVNAMMSKLRMGMPRTDVDATIGSPFQCTTGQPATPEDAKHKMTTCKYGDKNATGHLSVTYMDDAIWGMTYEK